MELEEAIEQIKTILNDETTKYYYNEEAINSINIVLNYISKLQKELEQEKEKNNTLKEKIRNRINEIGNKECEDMQMILFKYLIIEMLEDLLEGE